MQVVQHVDFTLTVPDHFRLRLLWIVSDGGAVKAQPPAMPHQMGSAVRQGMKLI